ncbi:MAG: hypothetical protein M0004_05720 [Actinomycetota bacterium]|nr:hypothetical protein [Actinomycetota bacterium]
MLLLLVVVVLLADGRRATVVDGPDITAAAPTRVPWLRSRANALGRSFSSTRPVSASTNSTLRATTVDRSQPGAAGARRSGGYPAPAKNESARRGGTAISAVGSPSGSNGGRRAIVLSLSAAGARPDAHDAYGGPPMPTETSWRAVAAAVCTVGLAAGLGLAPRPPRAGQPSCQTLSGWSVRRLAEQTLVIPVQERDVHAIRPEVAAGAGGVILFGARAPADLAHQLAQLGAAAPGRIRPLVMADEEGGAAQRLANLVGQVPAARTLGAEDTPVMIRRVATSLGRALRAAGVTMDLAPVADVDGGVGPNNRDPDGTRSFSADPTRASADVVAFLKGLAAGGEIAVVKHFPGLGGASGNTDVMAARTLSWPVEQRVGLPPFAAAIAAHVPAVMVSNATVPGLSTLPASLSPRVVEAVLRGRLGFHGLVLTDSLSAVAIKAAGFSVPEAAVAALRAGEDLVLYNPPSGSLAALTAAIRTAITRAVAAGSLSRSRLEAAVAHVLSAKAIPVCGTGVG